MSSSSRNYIPRPDGDFTAWANNYYLALKTWWSAHGLDPAELAGLSAALAAWNTAWASCGSARAAAAAAASQKNDARAALEPLVREFARIVQTSKATTNADRAAIGLTIPDAPAARIAAPTTRPVVRVETGQRLRHRLRFGDEATPTRSARPRRTAGAEVWLALVNVNQPPPPPPSHTGTGQSAYRFVQLSSGGEALAQFKAVDAGKTACYTLRWVSPTGERGPWSEVACATVAA